MSQYLGQRERVTDKCGLIFHNCHEISPVCCSMCVLGKRLLKDIAIENCTQEEGGQLWNIFCAEQPCDPYFLSHNLSIVRGIRGLSSGVFFENIFPSFLEDGQYITYGHSPGDIEQLGRPTFNQVYADITTSFTILIGIFFPSVTG